MKPNCTLSFTQGKVKDFCFKIILITSHSKPNGCLNKAIGRKGSAETRNGNLFQGGVSVGSVLYLDGSFITQPLSKPLSDACRARAAQLVLTSGTEHSVLVTCPWSQSPTQPSTGTDPNT